jgi:hypothetical protein
VHEGPYHSGNQCVAFRQKPVDPKSGGQKVESGDEEWMLRRLYNWVLHWAETPYAVPALAILAFTESSFFPIPPDVLLIALTLSVPSNGAWYATVCSVASVLGGWQAMRLAGDFGKS